MTGDRLTVVVRSDQPAALRAHVRRLTERLFDTLSPEYRNAVLRGHADIVVYTPELSARGLAAFGCRNGDIIDVSIRSMDTAKSSGIEVWYHDHVYERARRCQTRRLLRRLGIQASVLSQWDADWRGGYATLRIGAGCGGATFWHRPHFGAREPEPRLRAPAHGDPLTITQSQARWLADWYAVKRFCQRYPAWRDRLAPELRASVAEPVWAMIEAVATGASMSRAVSELAGRLRALNAGAGFENPAAAADIIAEVL